MKKHTLTFCLLLLTPWLFAQDVLTPDDDPDVLHLAAMKNLELQAEAWEKIAEKTIDREEKRVYQRLADSYRTWKTIREEKYLAEKNDQAVNYEAYFSQQFQLKNLEEEAVLLYGKDAPELPEEVKPKPEPEVDPTPTPVPEKSYTTESGFTVKFRLEE